MYYTLLCNCLLKSAWLLFYILYRGWGEDVLTPKTHGQLRPCLEALLGTRSSASAMQVLCTPKRARMIVVVVCVAAACTTLPEFFECRVQPQTDPSTNTTQLRCVDTWFGRSSVYSLGYNYANQALFTFIPLLLLAIFNALLIHAVLTAARRRQVMAKTGSQCITNRSASAAAATTGESHERHRSGQQRITVLLLFFGLVLYSQGI